MYRLIKASLRFFLKITKKDSKGNVFIWEKLSEDSENRCYNKFMKTRIFRTIIEPDDPRGYHGFVPLLPGVHTVGKTIEEVRENLKEAILCHLQGMAKDGLDIPQEEKTLESVVVFQDQDFKSLYA